MFAKATSLFMNWLIKKSFYRAFNAIYGKVGRLASVVVIELFNTKCMPILLYGLDDCPVSSRQLKSLNHVVTSCGRKKSLMVNKGFSNTFEIAAECLKLFEVSDVAEAVATRKDRFVNRYALNSSVVCEILSCVVKFFSILRYIYYVLPISVNKDVWYIFIIKSYK